MANIYKAPPRSIPPRSGKSSKTRNLPNLGAAQRKSLDAIRASKLHSAGISQNFNGDAVAECGASAPRNFITGGARKAKGKNSRIMKVGKRHSTLSKNQHHLHHSYNTPGDEDVAAVRGDEYIALVVMKSNGHWGYVRVRHDNIDVTDTPFSLFRESETHLVTQLWQRVVQHGSIPWTDEVFIDTMRIVRFKMTVDDCTHELLGERVDEYVRTSALTKLTLEEADALGLGHEKRKQSIMYDPQFNGRDKKLLADLQKAAAFYNLDVALDYLS
jgi:hypothetical protein